MDNLRHSPRDLTCNSQRTGFYSDGTWCAATLHRPAKPEAATLPAILMLHGWGGIQDALTVSYYEEFTRAGYAVMTFDYRGWGDSAGLPRHVISARQRVADADAALAFLKSQPGIDLRRIVLWGSSFGGGHAVELAAEHPELAGAIAQVPMLDGMAALRAVPPGKAAALFALCHGRPDQAGPAGVPARGQRTRCVFFHGPRRCRQGNEIG